MQNTSSTSELSKAFDLLVDAIEGLEARGRSTASAGVKPEMQRLTLGEFSEKRLGFNSFGAFVAAAEHAGFVVRIDTDKGYSAIKGTRTRKRPDIRGGPEEETTQPGPRLRSDLWRAFVDWRSEMTRVYDSKKGRAMMFPAAAQVGEDPKLAALRADIGHEKDRFVAITPISMETQYEWISEFIDAHQGHPLAVALHSTLKQDRPVKAFSHVIRADPALAQEWKRSRLARVAAVVAQWIGEKGLSVQPWERSSTPTNKPAQHSDSTAGLGRIGDESLRMMIHTAVDRMPTAELLRLSIPLEYLALQEQ